MQPELDEMVSQSWSHPTAKKCPSNTKSRKWRVVVCSSQVDDHLAMAGYVPHQVTEGRGSRMFALTNVEKLQVAVSRRSIHMGFRAQKSRHTPVKSACCLDFCGSPKDAISP